MEPVTLTAVATALATIVLTKSLEKVGENLGGLAWEKSIELVQELRQKNKLLMLTKSVEGNEQQRLDYGQAVLELKKAADTDPEIAQKVIEVEAAAKADPKLAPKVQELEHEINSQPANVINSSKLAESIKNVFQGNTFNKTTLDVLSPKEALQLLTNLVGERRVQKEEETAKLLCEWLGYLPLGLELVGRYVAKKPPNYKLAQMLERLKAQRLEDEAINRHQQQLKQTLSTAQFGALTAFELSWLELTTTTQCVGELLSLFAQDIFAWEWVESATEKLNWDATEVQIALEQLYERYLIQWVEDKSGDRDDCYKIHPLIREFLKVKLAASEQADELKRTFAETFIEIAKKIPQSPTQEIIKSVKDAIPHLAELAQNLIDAVSDENLIWVFVGLDRFYSGQGLYALAECWDKQCVSVVQSRLEEEHPYVAQSLNNLAYLYDNQGRYAEAEPLYKKALVLKIRLLGEEHPWVATSINDLANLYDNQGRYAEAEPLYQQALVLRIRLLGEEHPHVAQSLNNLANFYDNQGRYAEAEPLYQHALVLYKRLLGEEHPDVASTLSSLAYSYSSQKRYSEAELLCQQALEMRKRLLGEEHLSVAGSINTLARLYNLQGQHSKAKPLYQQALEMRKRLLGEEHRFVADSLNGLASVYASQKKEKEAKALYLEALRIFETKLGENHPDTISCRNSLEHLQDT